MEWRSFVRHSEDLQQQQQKKVNLICQSILIQLQFLVKHLSKTAKILHGNIDAEKFRQISTILFKLYSRQ